MDDEFKEQLKKEFDKWTSGNVKIDEIIQKSQLEAFSSFDILEWIDYNRMFNFTFIGKKCKACWKDGFIYGWGNDGLQRLGKVDVELQYIDKENLHEVLIEVI